MRLKETKNTPIVLNYFFISKREKEEQQEKIVNAILIEFDNIFKESDTIALFFTATKGRSLIKDYFHKPVYSLRENFKELLLYLYEESFDEVCINKEDNEFRVTFLAKTGACTKSGKLISINYCTSKEYEKGQEAIKELPYNDIIKEHCMYIFKKNKELLTAKETINLLKSNLAEIFVEAIMHSEDNWDKDMYSLKENNVLEDIASFWEEYLLDNPLYLDLKESTYFIYPDDNTLEFRFTNGEVIHRLTRTETVIYDLTY